MDCFYAQCERVRLGLPLDVKLCLFQWNSVLAVTYPAREYGIKRGDSWDDVAAKTKTVKRSVAVNGSSAERTNNAAGEESGCYTIHLPILSHDADVDRTGTNNCDHRDGNGTGDAAHDDDSIEASYRRIFELSPEEQKRCRRTENGVRRFHHQGKACLERYRLASMRIFAVVLESLQRRITQQHGYSFVLERASIDEFYLDLTDYCYRKNQNKDYPKGHGENTIDGEDGRDKTIIAGGNSQGCYNDVGTDDPLEIALDRACKVSYWIREDIWKILGFTMSAGISTNKTMAKLAASYGKPNGQAVLYPRNFPNVLSETKITKVRNFGGKLGKTVLKLILRYQQKMQPWNTTNESDTDALDRLKSTATMGDLNELPLPFLVQSKLLSNESAQFVFSAGRGIDHEEVKETSGALVKSITAFKSFTATKSHAEIFDRWLNLLAAEIVDRVARDTARNNRYPKSCTLNFTYYTTPNGQRPSGTTGSTRSQRQSRSLRLRYPCEREGTKEQKSASLLAQAKEKLIPIVKDHPLRGVGLSVSNFTETSKGSQQAREGTASIQSFFAAKNPAASTTASKLPTQCAPERGATEDREAAAIEAKETAALTKSVENSRSSSTGKEFVPLTSSSRNNPVPKPAPKLFATSGLELSNLKSAAQNQRNGRTAITKKVEMAEGKDLDYARRLQASFGEYICHSSYNG
jgi:nucleotidyltransferase/DNA polymerase involved in DNA repair